VQKGAFYGLQNTPKCILGAHDTAPDPLVGCGGTPLLIPHPTWRLLRLDSRAFGARHWAPRFEGALPPQTFFFRTAPD